MQQLELPFLTKIAKASSKSNSIRTTIPKEIADEFELRVHDVLIWKSDKQSGEITIKKWDGNG